MNMGSTETTTLLNNITIQWENISLQSGNVTKVSDYVDEADDAIWILTSTFIIFTMQSGMYLEKVIFVATASFDQPSVQERSTCHALLADVNLSRFFRRKKYLQTQRFACRKKRRILLNTKDIVKL